MSKEEARRIIDKLGKNHSQLAVDTGVNRRTILRWLSRGATGASAALLVSLEQLHDLRAKHG